ncbi:8149_t:CDS:2 [Entrophospora sp. SA101]|nr:8149_t:CDS:2 [Entrophospora sp. SA101]
MLENGIIRESTSSWASPIVVVKKKNNKLRDSVKIIQEPILSYYIDSDQESETGRLYVKNIPSSEEASPEKKNKEKETVSPIISAPSSPLQGRSEEGKEIQLSGISTNLRVMTTTINLNPTIKDILTGIPSVEIGPTGGGILGKLEKALGEYDCWAPGCKNKVRGKYTKCQTCNKCEHEGCTKETENQSRWCGDCWLRCKRPYCFRVGRIGGNNCSEHQSEEPVPCAWMGCGNKSENNRGYCQACQDKSDEMCDTPKCYQPRCKNSDLYCQECWEKNMKGIKGNTTMKSTTKGISSNITTGSGNSGEPAYKCLLNACIKKVEEYGEKCPNHRHCEHEGYEAYCYNHRTKEKTQCAVVNCHEKAGGRAWEYCDKCCTDIATLGQVTGCDEHDTNNLSCSKCRKIDIFKEYNEIRKEALKAKNVTFYALNKTKPSTSYGHWTKDCYASKQCNNCNGKGHLAKDCNKGVKCYGCGNFGHIAKECQKKKKSQDKRNNNNSQSYNGRPRRQNAYISQEEDTLSTLAATVGELAKKVENLKGDGSAKNTNEHPQTVPDCVTCDAEIWGTKVKAIVDTGSSGSIISKQCLDQLKRKIEESSNVSLIGINGQKHRPLGIVRNVHVTLDNKHPIEVTMQVTEATNYELILGVDWLRAINGVISIGEKILITTAYGTTNKHPIKVEKKPNIIEQPGDEEYEEESIQEEFAFLNRMITDHKPEQMIRTFTNIEWEDLEEEQKPTINRELTLKQQQKLDKFLQKHDDMFAGGLYELGHTQEEVHSIPTNCPFPQNQRAYHYPPKYNDFIKEEIQQMLENGIIRESTSSWASPIVVVKKKNNKLRFCVDYRKLNAYTEQDKYPLPLIADIFDSLEGSKYFSSLDLASGYWQMEVAEEDKKKTAFISKHGLYEFNRIDDMFAGGLYELGHTQEEVHSIPTNCPFPQNQRAYHYPPKYNDFIKEEIQQMLENGIIRESTSSWASPIVVVKKKNNKLRFCVDYRKLNAYTEQDKYPLPLIADIFDSLEGSKYFSSLDLASGYWQMEVAEEDKKKTAFISKHGLYEFNRMPFGLTNAPASFQRLMNKVLSKEIGRFVVVYLDDINIYSKSFEEHLEHLEIVFSRLRQAGLKLGKDKCSFAKTQLEFLGHIVGRDGLQPDPKK